jgi:ribosome-associated heat shock protein Hsp15
VGSRNKDKDAGSGQEAGQVRLDKWLWAARFFKTREISAAAITGGKVHYKGQRVKPARLVELGAEITIRQGATNRVVRVRALTKQRRSAPEAGLLYEETEESRRERDAAVQARRMERTVPVAVKGRPTKRARRQMERLLGKERPW